ncbi:MAG: hypothetical protein ACUVTB_06805 [Candidatus Bathycorpusculaceae bacterium]
MAKCKICGREIPNGLDICLECSKNLQNKPQLEKGEQQPTKFLSQWDKGYGSYRRLANIEQIVSMLQSGISETEIRFQLSLMFRPMTVDDYLKTAKEWLRRQKAKPDEVSNKA